VEKKLKESVSVYELTVSLATGRCFWAGTRPPTISRGRA